MILFRTYFFKKSFQIVFLMITLFLVSCSDDNPEIPAVVEGTEIANFSFLKAKNPSLPFDVYLTQEGNSFTGNVAYGTNIKNLVANYVHNGLLVEVNTIEQKANVTTNDFTNVVTYQVKTTDGRTQSFEVDVAYFTGLPIVNITTVDAVPINSKDVEVDGFMSIFGGRNFENFDNSALTIRGRGNSTWDLHPKKPYQIKLSDKAEVLGMPKDKKWIFLAEYSDKTLIRNKIAFEMGYLSKLEWTPKSELSEVFVNNEYVGTYNISQKVEESSNRVNLDDTGYLLEIDQLYRLDPEDVYFNTADFLVNIKEPELTYNSNEYIYIKDLVNEFETVLKGANFKDTATGYAKYIDVDSFVDWYLISEITKNQDSKDFSSIFFNVIPGEKIKMGPLWDFDLAFGNVNYSDATSSTGFWVKNHKWYARLFQDPSFVAKVKSRFIYFNNNKNVILSKMDSYANYLKYAQLENDKKWNLFGNYVWPNPVFYNTYQEEINHLKNWYSVRMNWLSTAINNL